MVRSDPSYVYNFRKIAQACIQGRKRNVCPMWSWTLYKMIITLSCDLKCDGFWFKSETVHFPGGTGTCPDVANVVVGI